MKYYDTTWNPLTGCTRCSTGCRHCVALDNLTRQSRPTTPMVNRRAFSHGVQGEGAVCMVCSQSDLFHEAFDESDVASVFEELARHPSNTFLVTTRRSSHMVDWLSRNPISLPNLYLGVSIENQQTAYRGIATRGGG